MAGDLPSNSGGGSTIGPPAGQWTPSYPTHSTPRSRTWPAIALAAIATVVAVTALIVALTRSTASAPSNATTTPTYTAAEVSAAQRQLCDTYNLASRAVRVETNGSDKALARIALSRPPAWWTARVDPASPPNTGTPRTRSRRRTALRMCLAVLPPKKSIGPQSMT